MTSAKADPPGQRLHITRTGDTPSSHMHKTKSKGRLGLQELSYMNLGWVQQQPAAGHRVGGKAGPIAETTLTHRLDITPCPLEVQDPTDLVVWTTRDQSSNS